MRIIGLMTLVCMLLMLAMIPACLQFARVCGVNPPPLTTAVLGIVLLTGIFNRRL